ncbi:MAG: dTMP kinase [Candidatus Sumerlaeia bacterium]|nr:dTMP kinase [Candidatus Sumerlaeia bacterium]
MSIEQSQSKKIPRGLLIAIEGIDGAGKTTQAKKLVEYLKQKGYPGVYLYEPTHGKYGKRLRQQAQAGRVSPEEEFKLFLKDRKEDVKQNILPALSEGKIVILDRYYYSSMAYQGARGLDPEMIRKANERIAPRADMVLYLKLPIKKSAERILKKRNTALDKFEGESYQRRVARIYNKMSQYLPEFKTIDARGDEEAVHKKIVRQVMKLIKKTVN